MKNHPSLFKDNSRDWSPSLKQPEPANAFTHKPGHDSCFSILLSAPVYHAGCLSSQTACLVYIKKQTQVHKHYLLWGQLDELSCLSLPSCWNAWVASFTFSRLCKEIYELWDKETDFLQVCLPVNWLWCRLCCKCCPAFSKWSICRLFLLRCLFHLIFLKCLWDSWISETSAPVSYFNKHLK